MKRLPAYSLLMPLLITATLAIFGSCRNDRPDGVPSSSKMVQVLYDYHLAQALAAGMEDSLQVPRYVEAALAKHSMTEQHFNRAMEYYTRHADQLYDIYGQVRERFAAAYEVKRGSIALGQVSGDTLDLWGGNAAYLLSSNAENRLTYAFSPDTLLRFGDRLVWQFNTRWMYHDGSKNAVAMLIVRYANDSTATFTRMVYSTGHQEVTLSIGKPAVARVSCILYQVSPWVERPRLLAVTQPALIRVRAATPFARPDSLGGDSLRRLPDTPERRLQDSLLRQDTARRDHFRPAESPVSRGFRPH